MWGTSCYRCARDRCLSSPDRGRPWPTGSSSPCPEPPARTAAPSSCAWIPVPPKESLQKVPPPTTSSQASLSPPAWPPDPPERVGVLRATGLRAMGCRGVYGGAGSHLSDYSRSLYVTLGTPRRPMSNPHQALGARNSQMGTLGHRQVKKLVPDTHQVRRAQSWAARLRVPPSTPSALGTGTSWGGRLASCLEG